MAEALVRGEAGWSSGRVSLFALKFVRQEPALRRPGRDHSRRGGDLCKACGTGVTLASSGAEAWAGQAVWDYSSATDSSGRRAGEAGVEGTGQHQLTLPAQKDNEGSLCLPPSPKEHGRTLLLCSGRP